MTNLGYGKIDFLTESWDDLRIVPGAFEFAGASDPAQTTWQPGGAGATFRVYEFASADQAFFSIQMPHKYKQGTDLKPHVHWTPADRGVAESGKTVAWKLDYSIANTHGTFGASTTVDLTHTCTGTNDYHELTASGTITGTDLTVSHIIMGRIYRDAGDTWASVVPGQLPILLEIDFHYQLDTLGSQVEATKTNKNA